MYNNYHYNKGLISSLGNLKNKNTKGFYESYGNSVAGIAEINKPSYISDRKKESSYGYSKNPNFPTSKNTTSSKYSNGNNNYTYGSNQPGTKKKVS